MATAKEDLFNSIDRNKDGVISKAEWNQAFQPTPRDAWATAAAEPIATEPIASDAGGGTVLSSRQRSSSPAQTSFQFKMNAQAAERARASGDRAAGGTGSGLSTPMRPYGVRALSHTRGTMQAAGARSAAQDTALLTAVRSQMAALEDKVGAQLRSAQAQTDRVREATLARLEEKIGVADALQPKFERRLAELTGNYKGLSDEMQSQIRRVDEMDSRLWEWRHVIEEEFNKKQAELEQQLLKVQSKARVDVAAAEEERKKQNNRLLRLEQELERCVLNEDLGHTLSMVYGRIEAIEKDKTLTLQAMENMQAYPKALNTTEVVSAGLLELIEQRMTDTNKRMEQLAQDVQENVAVIEQQKENLRTVNTQMQKREEDWQALKQRVDRGDWEGKLKQLQSAQQKEEKERIELQERMELASRRLENNEQTTEELHRAHEQFIRDQVKEQLMCAGPPPEDSELGSGALDSPEQLRGEPIAASVGFAPLETVLDLSKHLQRLEDSIQTQFLDFTHQQQALRAEPDDSMSQRVGQLISQLQEVVPKFAKHEEWIRELQAGKDEDQKHLKEALAKVQEINEVNRTNASAEGAEVTVQRVENLEEQVVSHGSQLDKIVTNMIALKDSTEKATASAQMSPSPAVLEEISRNYKDVLTRQSTLEQRCEEAQKATSELRKATTDLDRSPVSSPAADEAFEIARSLSGKTEKLETKNKELGLIVGDMDAKVNDTEAQWRQRHVELTNRHTALEEKVDSISNSTLADLKLKVEEQEKEMAMKKDLAEFALKTDLSDLATKSELDTLRRGTSDDKVAKQKLEELVTALKQDDEEEGIAYKKLVARVDELCERLADVTEAVAAAGVADGSTSNGERGS